MMKRQNNSGFSLIEMMIAIAVLTIIMGAMFQQIIVAQQRSGVEQAKLDLFQESREFMDQLTRDLHNAGYPNPRNYGYAAGTFQVPSPASQQSNAAAGLVKVDNGDLWFEGDVIGDGQVYVVHYHLDTDGTNCPCLKRSWQVKVPGDPLTGQTTPDYEVEVQNVLNGTANYPLATHPIFYAYYLGDTTNPVPLPVDTTGLIANVNTIKVVLTVQAKIRDPQTRLAPTATLVSTVKLNNCNTTAAGPMDCN